MCGVNNRFAMVQIILYCDVLNKGNNKIIELGHPV